MPSPTATGALTTVTRVVTVAAGVFAPGHLGELTRYLPFELVDDVLVQTRTVQRRLRELPSRTGVYFVLALGLFPGIGYARVWARLCAGLTGGGLVVPAVSEKALRDLRRRLGPAPLKALFEVVAGPLAQPRTLGTCFAGLRTVAFDGLNSLKVPDTDRNRGWMGRIRYRMGFAGYPTLRLMCLAETGTRGLLGATIGAADDRDEATLAWRLLPLLRPGMLLLLDRGFDAATFLAAVHRTGAMLLARVRSQRIPPVLQHLPDGSYLSDLDGLAVRIIEADLTMSGADGTQIGDRYRLITTLLDHRRYPAEALIRLYHERWEIESAYLALRHTMLARARPALRRPGRAGTRGLGAADALPAAAHGHGRRGRDPSRHQPRPGQLHHRPAGRPRPAHRRCRGLPRPRRARRPARGHRPGRAGHAAARPPGSLQRPQGQMRDLPLPQPRRRPPRRLHRRHRDRHPRCTPRLSTWHPDLDPSRAAAPVLPGHQPAATASPRCCAATPTAAGAAPNSPRNCRSRSTTCSPSSPNGPAWGSSPAPAPAPTRSTHRRRSSTSRQPS